LTGSPIRAKLLAALLAPGLLAVTLLLPAPARAQDDLKLTGTLAGLPAGGVTFPLGADVPATIFVGGLASLPAAFTVTPRTDSALPSLRNGDFVRVDLTLVGGRVVAVEIQ
jgi:hypothetical protein